MLSVWCLIPPISVRRIANVRGDSSAARACVGKPALPPSKPDSCYLCETLDSCSVWPGNSLHVPRFRAYGKDLAPIPPLLHKLVVHRLSRNKVDPWVNKLAYLFMYILLLWFIEARGTEGRAGCEASLLWHAVEGRGSLAWAALNLHHDSDNTGFVSLSKWLLNMISSSANW